MNAKDFKNLLDIKEEINTLEQEYNKYSKEDILDYMVSNDIIHLMQKKHPSEEAINIIEHLLICIENHLPKAEINKEIHRAKIFIEDYNKTIE